jgi:transcriptional regulator with XRE-family HTH domain
MEITAGRRIAAAREAARLSQAQLGQRLNVTSGVISKWETDRNMPGLRAWRGLVQELPTLADLEAQCAAARAARRAERVAARSASRGDSVAA